MPHIYDNAVGAFRAPQVSDRRPLARPSVRWRARGQRQPANSRQQERQDKQHQEARPRTRPTAKTLQGTTSEPMTTKQKQDHQTKPRSKSPNRAGIPMPPGRPPQEINPCHRVVGHPKQRTIGTRPWRKRCVLRIHARGDSERLLARKFGDFAWHPRVEAGVELVFRRPGIPRNFHAVKSHSTCTVEQLSTQLCRVIGIQSEEGIDPHIRDGCSRPHVPWRDRRVRSLQVSRPGRAALR